MKRNDFSELMKEQEQRKRMAGAESTADLYRAVRNRLVCFFDRKELLLKRVTASVVSDFMSFLKKEKLQTNTVNTYVSCLRAMYHRACRELGHKPKEDPFTGIRLKREETTKRAVPVETIQKIAGMSFRDEPELEVTADLALFCFMACGMPYTDMAHLTVENIHDGGKTLEYRRQKTNVLIRVELNDGMQFLIDKYACKDRFYLFPVLSANVTHEQYKKSLANFNLHLKELGKRLDLSEPLTSYVFRHSWASAAYQANMRIGFISSALGHTSEKMTRTYLAQLDIGELAKANKKVVGGIEKMLIMKSRNLIYEIR